MFLLLVLIFKFTLTVAPYSSMPTTSEILFLISRQDNNYHRQLSEQLRNNIMNQSHLISSSSSSSLDYIINVHMLDEIFKHPGDWTILTAVSHLMATTLVNDNTKWIIWCEESTHIELEQLLMQLAQENHTKAFYLGYPLYDQESTIIHHFAFFENPKWFPYPLLRAGVIFTAALFRSLALQLNDDVHGKRIQKRTDFTIDAAHELALFIMEHIQIANNDKCLEGMNNEGEQQQHCDIAKGRQHESISLLSTSSTSISRHTKEQQYRQQQQFANVRKMILKRASYICPKAKVASPSSATATTTSSSSSSLSSHTHRGSGTIKSTTTSICAMHAKPMDISSCHRVGVEQIYFAIKTCQKFHQDRIPILEATWIPFTIHKRYFSDITDTNIPTIDTGIPNTEMGHCSKTLAIFKLALKDIKQMNRSYLQKNSTKIEWLFLSDDDTLLSVAGVCEILGCFDAHKEIYLGERYGYRLHAADGFNYITAGGGIAMSLPTVERILEYCSCPSESAPDDMILGSCLNALQIAAIHTPRFHQARPNDYADELLEIDRPITFHKFWQLDPIGVYEKWFATADRQLSHQLATQRQTIKANYQNQYNLYKKNSNLIKSVGRCKRNILSEIQICLSKKRNDVTLTEKLQLHSNNKNIDL